MKLHGIALALALASTSAWAQSNQGSSPLTPSKGGTNSAFVGFTGPASTVKTFTLPNASDTISTLGAIQTVTAAKTFASAKLLLAGSSSGTTTLNAAATASGVLTLPAATDTLVGRATTDTLTNKTLTSPALTTPSLGVAIATSINKVAITAPATAATLTIPDGVTLTGPAASGTAMTLGNIETVTGAKTFGSTGAVGRLKIAGTTSGSVILDASAIASGTLTLPSATDVLIGRATTDTLTNKTFDTAGAGNSLSINGLAATANTGTGALVRATSPTLVTPALGTPASGVATNLTGTAAGLTAGNVTTNANLTGPITSTGNATAIASQTGTGSKFVMDTSPTLISPALGTPSSGIATNLTGTAAGLMAGNVTTNANLTGEVTSVGNSTTVTNSSVIGKLLTAFASGAGTVSSSDSILTALQKVVGNIALKADINSPTFTGTPAAPTPTAGDNTTKLATTAFVANAVAESTSGVASFNGATGIVTTSIVKQKITTSGTYTPTSGMKYAIIECQGPGGGGGGIAGASSNGAVAGAGGAGGYSKILVDAATVGAPKTVTIGTGGAGGTAGNNAGAAGSAATSVGSLCVANAGSGGSGAAAGSAAGIGGAGGAAGTGDLAIPGQGGAHGLNSTIISIAFSGANGPNSHYGNGGQGVPTTGGGAAGNAAGGFGAGGSGALANNNPVTFAGGAGSSGVVYITEFVQN